MPRISHVQWPKMRLDYGFLFEIRTEKELRDYWMNCRKGSMVEGLQDYIKTANGRGHIHTPNGALLHAACLVEEQKEVRRSVVQVWCDIQDEVYTKMLRCIRECGKIFVNRVGGYFVPLADFNITDTQDILAYALPGNKITVTQWPNGTHWYARVGGQDVEMFGSRKWDTEKEATRIAQQWAKEHGIFVE